MRKRQMTPIPQDVPSRDEGWLDLDREAMVEVTSEEKEYPIESVCTGTGRNAGLESCRLRHSNHPDNLRSAAKP